MPKPAPRTAKAPPRERTPLGDEIRTAIDESGLTSHALAKEAGVATSTISRYRNGTADLTVGRLESIARILNLRLIRVQARSRRGRKPTSG